MCINKKKQEGYRGYLNIVIINGLFSLTLSYFMCQNQFYAKKHEHSLN